MQERVDGNRLKGETSPYLLQHKDNPVHWRPWGEAALAEAKATGKPILLSVGYAACHWCHVMAHESFEDEATAVELARLGCDAYAFAMVALGTLDLVVESGLKSWDVEAAVPVIEGAGGLLTDWAGQRLGREGGRVAAAGDPRVLRGALPILRRA